MAQERFRGSFLGVLFAVALALSSASAEEARPNALAAVLDQFLAEDAASQAGVEMDVTAYIDPSYVVLGPGEIQQFNIFRLRRGEQSPTKMTGVKWSLDGAGKIDRKGLYTAPIDPRERLRSVTVRASIALEGSTMELASRVAFPLVTESAP